MQKTVRKNWITHHGSLDGQRFSRLDQINKKTVKDLKVAFTHIVGGIGGAGVWGGTPGSKERHWRKTATYISPTVGAACISSTCDRTGSSCGRWIQKPIREWAAGVTCCGVDNRGVALWRDKVISHRARWAADRHQ